MRKIAILLGTLNGAKYIDEQLKSIIYQTHKNWHLYVSDDGSTDNTLEILYKFQEKFGESKITIRNGPRQGFAQNYLSMLCDMSIEAEYFSFCDQDDIWLENKLEVAVSMLYKYDSTGCAIPRCYGSRTIYIDDKGCKIGYSKEFVHPGSFRNALVQSIAGANTMVINQHARNLIAQAGYFEITSHDWWSYLLITAAGGIMHYDKTPYILYRQHPNSLIGQNRSFLAKFKRANKILARDFSKQIDLNISCLRKAKCLISEENNYWLEYFIKMRSSSLKDRIRMFEVCGLYRQSLSGTISLIISAIFRLI